MIRPLAVRLGGLWQRWPLLMSLAVVFPPAVAVVVLQPPYFETNDDSIMMLSLSGRATSVEPTAHVIFMHIFLGRVLAALYGLAPAMPWYALALIGSSILALSAMLYALMLDGFSRRRLALFAGCLVCVGLPFLALLQFTRVSMLVGLSGVFLLWSALQARLVAGAWSARSVRLLIGAFLLLALSFMIRRDSLLLVLAIALPVLMHLTGKYLRARLVWTLLVTFSCLGALLLTLEHFQVRGYGRDAEWKQFGDLNRVKSSFIDYGRIPYDAATRRYFEEVGWSENDYWMLMNWFYVDAEVFSLEKMTKVESHFAPGGQSPVARVLGAGASLLPAMVRNHMVWISALLALGIALVGIRDRSHLLALLSTALFLLLLLVGMLAFLKLPLRIYQPTVTAVCWLALMLVVGQAVSRDSRRRLQAAGLALIFVALAFTFLLDGAPGRGIISHSRAVAAGNQELRQSLGELEPLPSQTYVSWGSGFPFENILPLEDKDYLDGLRIIAVGGANRSPTQRRMMASQGITDIPLALLQRDEVFLVISPRDLRRGFASLLVTYMKQHYGEHVEIVRRHQQGDLSVWSMIRSRSELQP